jgi:D-glycero-alpha-D-manno-heptose-7-phosphate kinase
MITSSAPTRIDLAGGTLDIWPLYLLLDSPPTLNAAIDLYATVNLKPRKDKAILIESQDLGLKQHFSSMQAFPDKHPLELIMRIIKFYNPTTGLEVTTHCQAPAGSGIGGSSALNIALNGAFNRLTGKKFNAPQLIEIAKNIETQVIKVPAGLQDYYPAIYGGVQSILPGILNVEPEKIPVDMTMLNKRFILCYSGKPRQSGINNWQVLKMAIDGHKRILQKLNRIKTATEKIDRILRKDKLPGFASQFDEEWQARKSLASGISTPHIERLIKAAKQNGALAAKVCGAGGGGCVAFYIKEGTKEKISSELNRLGGSVLPFKFVKRGLKISS